MSLEYNTDLGYGIRIVARPAADGRPKGHVVEIHFYDRSAAVKYAVQLIQAAGGDLNQWLGEIDIVGDAEYVR